MTNQPIIYQRSLDDRGRIGVLGFIQPDMVITTSQVFGDRENYLFACSRADFNKRAEGLIKNSPNPRRMCRFLYTDFGECDIDTQGRLEIPENLRRFIGMPTDVVIVYEGVKSLRIWNKEEWDKRYRS